MESRAAKAGLRTVALIEASKGVLVLAVGLGLLTLIGQDVEVVAEQVARHFHLNPSSKYPRIISAAAGAVTDARLWMLAAGALGYAAIRLAEAYGLWRGRAWAEWLGAVSAGVYIPFEVYGLFQEATLATAMLLTLNVAIVAFLLWILRRRHATKGRLRAANQATRLCPTDAGHA